MGRPFTPQATSLCITSRPEFSDARPNLMRVADVADGRLVKASVNSEQERIFENRDAFFYKDITSEQSKIGYLGFYRWSTTEQMENPMKDYVQVSPVCGQTPTEVISMSHLEDQRQLVKKLLAGVAITPTAETRHILFTIEESKYSCVGLLVEKGSLKQQADGLFALSKQVSILKQYVILTRNILTIPVPMAGKLQECGVPKTLRLCERLDLGEADEIINVKSPVEIVRDIVLQKASWGRYSQLIDGGTHAQHDALKAFIAQVGEDTLMEEEVRGAFDYNNGSDSTALSRMLFDCLQRKKACFITTPDVALLREVYTDQMADNMLALDCGGVFRTILVQNEYATAFKGETLEIPEAISPLHMKVAGPYSAIIREAAVRLTGRGDCSLDGLLFSNGTGKRGTVDGDESELNGLTLSPGTGTFPLPPPKTTSKDNTGL